MSCTPIRSRRGRRVHIIAVDETNDGSALCGRGAGAGGWVVAFGRVPDCASCLALAGDRIRRRHKRGANGTRLARRR